jgi:hypothetical protein
VAQRDGLISPGCPFYTGVVFCHHIIIIMEIDDDLMAKYPTVNHILVTHGAQGLDYC